MLSFFERQTPVCCNCGKRVLYFWWPMTARQSPAVRYPLRDSRWLGTGWLCVALACAVLLVLWIWRGAGSDGAQAWRIAAAVCMAAVCLGLSGRAVCRQPQGLLSWSGREWLWEQAQHLTALGRPQVLLDLQTLMVVCWEDEQQRRHRLVLEKNCSPALWMDLRRAVYSSVYLPPPSSVSARP